MNVQKIIEGTKATIVVEGHVDSVTAPTLEAEIKSVVDGVIDLYIDLAAVEYISSAGLRVVLGASKIMAAKGKMFIINTPSHIKEIFDMTGFSEVLNIQ